MQIPHAEEGTICPLHKVDCSTVCHKCPWWTRIIGKNPQSEEMLDDWRCAVAMLPMLLIENAQVTRQGTATMETFRNGVVESVGHALNTMAQAAIIDNRTQRLGHH
jgi:hypothetical protein